MNQQRKMAIQQAAIQQTVAIANAAERQLDQAIEHFDNLTTDDYTEIRKKRLQQLQEKQNMRGEWLRLGHGKYEEIPDEKQWFEEAKTNKHLITHFYRGTTEYCKVIDYHLDKLAKTHIEARFVRLDAEKCPYLVQRLNIYMMPTIILTEDNFAADKIEGFAELGNTDKFTTDQLAERLSKKGIIDYTPPPPSGSIPGEMETSNRNNKSGAAIYESQRQRVISEMKFDDDFLDSTDDEGKEEKKPIVFASVDVAEDKDLNENLYK